MKNVAIFKCTSTFVKLYSIIYIFVKIYCIILQNLKEFFFLKKREINISRQDM